jgi:beta-lactamase regulating signal transducer with metallopeptidase domain
MTSNWVDILAIIGAQHLWQGTILLLLAGVAFKLRPVGAEARSWIWLCIFLLAVASPLAVFLPGSDPVAVDTPATRAAGIAVADIASTDRSAAADGLVTAAMLSALKSAALLTWLCGFAWSLSRLFGGWREARRLRDAAQPLPYLARLLQHELPADAMVKVSDQVGSPMVVGLSRQCILVPRTLLAELTEQVLLDILRHEIAHVRRRDMWVSLLQRFFQSVYWWSPVLRMIGTRLSLAREMACDERAALQSHGSRTYASSLLTSVDKVLSLDRRRHLLASGIFDTGKGLAQRIQELMTMETHVQRCGHKSAWMLCGTILATSIALTLFATPRVGYAAMAAATDHPSARSGEASLLIAAAEAGRQDEVRQLVRGGVRVDARVAGEGTALIAASRAGQLPMVDMLLRMRAPVDQYSLRDGSPLIVASMNGHLDVVERLVRAGANVNAIVKFDETPLINAARGGHLPVVEYLVEHGANVNLGVRADFGLRSPLNQAQDGAVRDYLVSKGAVAGGS